MKEMLIKCIDRSVGPLLDLIGTRTEIVGTEGNITNFAIFDSQTNEQIGEGILMVRDGVYMQQTYYKPSALRENIITKIS